MENSYGIGVRNRYELFYDEEVDPLDYLKQTEIKKKDKIAEKENKGKTTKTKDSLPGKKAPKNEIGTKPTAEKTSQPVNNKQQQQQQPQQQQSPQQSPPQPQQVPQQQKPRNNDRVKFSDREERNNRRNKPEGELRDNREPRETREPREPREVRDPREPKENGAPQRFDGEGRGGGRGGMRGGAPFRGGRGGPRRGGRGGPGMGAGDFRGKREFDRQSGMVTSGVKQVDKRDGSGSFNWGSDKDQIEEQLQDDQNADLDTSGENPEKPPAEEGNPAPTEDDGPKEDDNQKEMTLDEWKALQKREKPIFKIRRAGEGENTAQWKKTYVLKKKEKEEGSDEEEEESDEEEVHHGRKKVLLPIDFQFADTPTRGRGRGRGRGGPGGRGRGIGGARGRGGGARFQGGSRQEAPKMDDERDFPSLG